MSRSKRRAVVADGLTYVILIVATLLALVPVAWLFLTSLEPDVSSGTGRSSPRSPLGLTLANYNDVLVNSSFSQNLLNSLLVCVASVVAALALGFLAAYGLSRYRVRGGSDIAFWILSNRMLPPISVVVPLYLLLSSVNGLDKYWSLIAVYTAFSAPYAVWLMRGFLLDIPRELDQAALVDGCSPLGVLRHVILPLCAPALLASGVFLFVPAWSEFLFAFMLTSANTKTLPVAIASLITDQGIRWGDMTAAGSLLILPLVVAFFFVQKHLVRGLTFGALK